MKGARVLNVTRLPTNSLIDNKSLHSIPSACHLWDRLNPSRMNAATSTSNCEEEEEEAAVHAQQIQVHR